MAEKTILEKLKARKEKFLERIRGKAWSWGEEERIIGKGKLIDKATARLDKITARIKERGIIPAVRETFERWEPGKRVKEIMAPAEEGELEIVEEKPKTAEGKREKEGIKLRT